MTSIEKTRDIWEAFCEELTQEPTDDMKEALATALRVASVWILPSPNNLDRDGFGYREFTKDERDCANRLLTFSKELKNL